MAKSFKNLKIRLGTDSDIQRIREISDIQLGVKYLSDKKLKSYLRSSVSTILVAAIDNKVCGFSIFFTADFKGIISEIGDKHYNLLKDFERFTQIRLKKTTVVDPEYSGRGIGSALTKEAEQYKAESVDLTLTLNWKRTNEFPMHSISQKLNYSLLGEIDMYWKEQSLQKRFTCPECGEPPCTCNAVILFRVEKH